MKGAIHKHSKMENKKENIFVNAFGPLWPVTFFGVMGFGVSLVAFTLLVYELSTTRTFWYGLLYIPVIFLLLLGLNLLGDRE